jgi:hypothetical protein
MANNRFERDAPPASFACCLRTPQAKRLEIRERPMSPEFLAIGRELYKPVMTLLESFINAEKEKYQALASRDHDEIGRILKLHLIMEYYLGQYLKNHMGISEQKLKRQNFFTKASQLPDHGFPQFVRHTVLSFNRIRNCLAHDLGVTLHDAKITKELLEIEPLLGLFANVPENASPIEKLEAFAFVIFSAFTTIPKDIEAEMNKVTGEVMRLISNPTVQGTLRDIAAQRP